MDGVAVVVGQYLDFDVPRPLDVFLDVHTWIAKRRLGLRTGLAECRFQGEVVRGDPHALAATARRGFDEHGEADLVSDSERGRVVVDQPVATRDGRYVGFASELARAMVVSAQGHGCGHRPRHGSL